MGKIIKDACALLAITLVAGILLGYVYQITKEPIAQQELLTEQNSCKEVFADADSFSEVSNQATLDGAQSAMESAGYVATLDKAYMALDANGQLLGYVMSVTDPEGYGGDISFMVGVQNDGTVNGISILSISETAGLGMNADKDDFKDQFKNKNVEVFTYTKTGSTQDSEIDAISGATFTTKTMVNGTNAALEAFRYMESEAE